MSIEPPSKRSKMGSNTDAGPSSENPYLAHLGPKAGSNGSTYGNGTGSNGVSAGGSTGSGKNPLNGLVPRMVTTEQAKNILVSYLLQVMILGLI